MEASHRPSLSGAARSWSRHLLHGPRKTPAHGVILGGVTLGARLVAESSDVDLGLRQARVPGLSASLSATPVR